MAEAEKARVKLTTASMVGRGFNELRKKNGIFFRVKFDL